MSGLMRQFVSREARALSDVRSASPETATVADSFLHTLVAFPLGGEACLVQFNEYCSFTIADEALPFVCLGIGQAIADHFLAFVRRVLWRDGAPTLGLGITSAMWTMRHVIATNALGIQDPTQVVTLTHEGDALIAHGLTEAELKDHKESVDAIEDRITRWGAQFSAAPIESAPIAPPQ